MEEAAEEQARTTAIDARSVVVLMRIIGESKESVGHFAKPVTLFYGIGMARTTQDFARVPRWLLRPEMPLVVRV